MSEANVALVRRFFEELWNQRRPELAPEFLTEESYCIAEGGDIVGIDNFVEGTYKPFIAAFPDLSITIEGTLAAGDEVLVRWSAAGTHHGPAFGIEPSGKRIGFRGMSWFRMRDGKFREGWQTWNLDGLLLAMKGEMVPPSMTVE